jgi:NAD(P)-dependent dehydrogenase (short-subunit alcohol dehydrogenase family)
MERRLEGRIAIITGGAGGIGAATAARYVREGARVVVADVQDDLGRRTVDSIGDGAEFVQADVSREADIERLVDDVVTRHGRLDVFYANAGVFGAVGPIAQTRTEDLDLTLAINLRGVFLCVKHAARVMIPQRSGVILATSSPGGIIGGVGPHAYSASKAGVSGLCRSAAAELREHGIRVISIVPGAIVSPMTADCLVGDPRQLDEAARIMQGDALMERTGVPDDIAGAAVFAASDDASYMTGAEMIIDAGYTHAHGNAWATKDQFVGSHALLEGGRRSE